MMNWRKQSVSMEAFDRMVKATWRTPTEVWKQLESQWIIVEWIEDLKRPTASFNIKQQKADKIDFVSRMWAKVANWFIPEDQKLDTSKDALPLDQQVDWYKSLWEVATKDLGAVPSVIWWAVMSAPKSVAMITEFINKEAWESMNEKLDWFVDKLWIQKDWFYEAWETAWQIAQIMYAWWFAQAELWPVLAEVVWASTPAKLTALLESSPKLAKVLPAIGKVLWWAVSWSIATDVQSVIDTWEEASWTERLFWAWIWTVAPVAVLWWKMFKSLFTKLWDDIWTSTKRVWYEKAKKLYDWAIEASKDKLKTSKSATNQVIEEVRSVFNKIISPEKRSVWSSIWEVSEVMSWISDNTDNVVWDILRELRVLWLDFTKTKWWGFKVSSTADKILNTEASWINKLVKSISQVRNKDIYKWNLAWTQEIKRLISDSLTKAKKSGKLKKAWKALTKYLDETLNPSIISKLPDDEANKLLQSNTSYWELTDLINVFWKNKGDIAWIPNDKVNVIMRKAINWDPWAVKLLNDVTKKAWVWENFVDKMTLANTIDAVLANNKAIDSALGKNLYPSKFWALEVLLRKTTMWAYDPIAELLKKTIGYTPNMSKEAFQEAVSKLYTQWVGSAITSND